MPTGSDFSLHDTLANKTAREFIASDFVLQVRKHNQLQDLKGFAPHLPVQRSRGLQNHRQGPLIMYSVIVAINGPIHSFACNVHTFIVRIYVSRRVTSGSGGLESWTLSSALLTQLYFGTICLGCLLAGTRCLLVCCAAVSQSKLTLPMCVRAEEAHTRPKLM